VLAIIIVVAVVGRDGRDYSIDREATDFTNRIVLFLLAVPCGGKENIVTSKKDMGPNQPYIPLVQW
jgi:hypothetical protein